MSVMETNANAQQLPLHPLAALYQRFVMDPLVEVARAISHDLIKRPRHYQDVPENIANNLEDFRLRTGSDPKWPSTAQRANLIVTIFDNTFWTTSRDLMSAAVTFAESSTEKNLDTLEDRVRDTAMTLRAYLRAIDRRSISRADSETGPMFQSTVEVFQNEAVAGAFGLRSAPGGNWPFDGILNGDDTALEGAYLIEEIERSLVHFNTRPILTQYEFILLQRIAHYGAITIAGLLNDAADWSSSDWVPSLVRKTYGWEKALESLSSYTQDQDKSLQPRVVSQNALDDEELKLLPTEEDKRSGRLLALAVSTGRATACNYTGTLVCGGTSTGDTSYCDKATCTYGWTFTCDYSPFPVIYG